jgi:glycosyltransferase involved in cell wall biosynthesis
MKVTVAITTYNSEKFILETLNSIYNQSYSTLELVISDDFSKDQTLNLVHDWVRQEHVKERFTTIQVLTVQKNTGVSANLNRCIAASSSKWIKFIAGDDILLPNCIEDNVAFINENSDARVIFSQVKVYQDTFEEVNFVKTTPNEFPSNLMDKSIGAYDQFQLLLLSDRIQYTPSSFFSKEAMNKVGNFDESNKLVEDYPMWLKLTGSGERLYYFHKVTVGYRIHAKATNNKAEGLLFKPSIFNSFEIRKKLAHPHLPWEIVASEFHTYLVSKFFSQMNWNKKTKTFEGLYKVSCFYLNPFQYIYALKKRLPMNKQNTFYS